MVVQSLWTTQPRTTQYPLATLEETVDDLKKKSAKTRPKKALTVQRLSSKNPAARDEGPRLIPLDPGKPAAFQHYLDLADAAMGYKKKGS